jgi:zinc transport system substrate-binding protein
VQKAVLDSDLFVYTVEGFQPWADDLVASLREDEADITMVKAGSGIDLLEEGDDHGRDEANGTEDERGHDSESEHDGEQENQSDSGHNETDSKRDEGHRNENDSSHDEEHGNESSDEHGHAHQAEADPHFWLDPMRAKQAVSNIRQEFVDLDSANADAYATNADQYRSRLEDLDSTIQSALNNRSKNVVFVAGHNAFGYLGERYGFEAETLTGLSPDDQPTPKDIERAQEIINEHGLEYVLADPLESQRAAQQLVAETSAREVLPLTPIPGQTQEWANKGWGYVEIMEQINLPTLKQALGAR